MYIIGINKFINVMFLSLYLLFLMIIEYMYFQNKTLLNFK